MKARTIFMKARTIAQWGMLGALCFLKGNTSLNPLNDSSSTANSQTYTANSQKYTANSQIYIFLDAGHGGNDVGAAANGVSEDETAYDIMVRTKKKLEEQNITVIPLVYDTETGFNPQDELRNNTAEYVLTTPRYKLENAVTGIYARLMKINVTTAELLSTGASLERMVFASIHVDARRRRSEGVDIYIPGTNYQNDAYTQFSLLVYNGKLPDDEAVQKQKTVDYNASRSFAEALLINLTAAGVVIHKDAIYDTLHRSDGEYLPAVLLVNPIPRRVLIETGNCQNPTDAKRLLTSQYREAIAEGIVNAVTDLRHQ